MRAAITALKSIGRTVTPVATALGMLAAFGCATHTGDLNQNVGLKSNLPEPSRSPEPSRPAGFPDVQLLVEQTHSERGPVIAAMRPIPADTSTDVVEDPKPQGLPETTPSDPVEPPPVDDVDSGSIIDSPTDQPIDDIDSGSLIDSGSIVDTGSIVDADPEPQQPDATPTPDPTDTPTETIVGDGANKPADTEHAILATLGGLKSGNSAAEKRFTKDATKAIRRSYEEDYSDPAILLSLDEKLRSDASLKGLQSSWTAPLAEAVERTRGLQKVTFSIRRLKGAFEKARWDGEMTVYRGLDIQTCRLAFKQINEAGPELMKLVVTIAPAGTHSLERFETMCNDSHGAALMERDFPRVKGPPRLRKQVKKLFQKAFAGAKVHKVTIEKTWTLDEEGETKILTAIAGVERKDAFPEDPCVMQKVLLKRTKSGRRWDKPSCCDIEETTAVACGVLK